jgi:hypothetical protein
VLDNEMMKPKHYGHERGSRCLARAKVNNLWCQGRCTDAEVNWSVSKGDIVLYNDNGSRITSQHEFKASVTFLQGFSRLQHPLDDPAPQRCLQPPGVCCSCDCPIEHLRRDSRFLDPSMPLHRRRPSRCQTSALSRDRNRRRPQANLPIHLPNHPNRLTGLDSSSSTSVATKHSSSCYSSSPGCPLSQ